MKAWVNVWDWPVRALHLALIAGVALAWLTSEMWTQWHDTIGYAALVVVLLRLLWGAVGSGYARFGQFVRGPRQTAGYLARLLRGRAARHLGHNPLGGWMVLLLLGCVAAVGGTGWLCTTDRYWGDETMSAWHSGLAWTLVALVVLHVMGVLAMSVQHRENLVAAMLHGRKREPHEGDVS
jgi:cytochrome b